MKKIFLVLFIIFILINLVGINKPAFAACTYSCSGSGSCNPSCPAEQECCAFSNNGSPCICQDIIINNGGGGTTTNIFGEIKNPITTGALGDDGGLVQLLNNVLRLIFVVAGIYAFIQLILAGLGFISAGGDPKKIEKSWNVIWQSILGLVIIISSLALAALMGQILFGNPTAILNPKIYGPGGNNL